MTKYGEYTLKHPWVLAVCCIAAGVSLGAILELGLEGNHFQRAGNITLLAGILSFGASVGELVTRAQTGHLGRPGGDQTFPLNRSNLAQVFAAETVVVTLGSVQSGYGDLLVEVFK